jgi:hypothetical protein
MSLVWIHVTHRSGVLARLVLAGRCRDVSQLHGTARLRVCRCLQLVGGCGVRPWTVLAWWSHTVHELQRWSIQRRRCTGIALHLALHCRLRVSIWVDGRGTL